MEELVIKGSSRGQIYEELLPQVQSVVSAETDLTANLANVSAMIKEALGFWWVGFYLIKDKLAEDNSNGATELVLGPFQGPLACTRIQKGRGVCGTCWEREEAVVVEDVELFPGHIA